MPTPSKLVYRVSSPEIRFWKYVRKTDGCWFWTGSLQGFGYGRISVNKSKLMMAHRFSWELHNGPIPEGLWVLHHCDTPSCVRPDHLFIGTHRDNDDDRDIKCRGNSRLVQAFGETKPLCMWARDSRCLVKRKTFTKRLDKGVPPEEAMTSLFDVPARRTKSGKLILKPLPKQDVKRKGPCVHEPVQLDQNFCFCKLCGGYIRQRVFAGKLRWATDRWPKGFVVAMQKAEVGRLAGVRQSAVSRLARAALQGAGQA